MNPTTKERQNIMWNSSSKEGYREHWITQWKKITKHNTIPKNKVLITLGGRSYGNKGYSLASWSELSFLLNKKVIKPTQYYSIEENRFIQMGNSKIKQGNWIYGDFVEELEELITTDKLNPAIINYDCCATPRITHDDLGKILLILNTYNIHDVLVCYNVLLHAHYIVETVDSAKDTLLDNYWIASSLTKSWRILKPYEYIGGTKTPMCCFMFFRK
ncbi:MAG TPA: hypothetical protein P5136_01500 [Methanofastidiosum sp.]|nr:hypothetical protein [Methanofastidiosum sp.]